MPGASRFAGSGRAPGDAVFELFYTLSQSVDPDFYEFIDAANVSSDGLLGPMRRYYASSASTTGGRNLKVWGMCPTRHNGGWVYLYTEYEAPLTKIRYTLEDGWVGVRGDAGVSADWDRVSRVSMHRGGHLATIIGILPGPVSGFGGRDRYPQVYSVGSDGAMGSRFAAPATLAPGTVDGSGSYYYPPGNWNHPGTVIYATFDRDIAANSANMSDLWRWDDLNGFGTKYPNSPDVNGRKFHTLAWSPSNQYVASKRDQFNGITISAWSDADGWGTVHSTGSTDLYDLRPMISWEVEEHIVYADEESFPRATPVTNGAQGTSFTIYQSGGGANGIGTWNPHNNSNVDVAETGQRMVQGVFWPYDYDPATEQYAYYEFAHVVANLTPSGTLQSYQIRQIPRDVKAHQVALT